MSSFSLADHYKAKFNTERERADGLEEKLAQRGDFSQQVSKLQDDLKREQAISESLRSRLLESTRELAAEELFSSSQTSVRKSTEGIVAALRKQVEEYKKQAEQAEKKAAKLKKQMDAKCEEVQTWKAKFAREKLEREITQKDSTQLERDQFHGAMKPTAATRSPNQMIGAGVGVALPDRKRKKTCHGEDDEEAVETGKKVVKGEKLA